MMPADLERLHKELREFERIDAVSDEMRAVSEELRPGLALTGVAERARISLGYIRQPVPVGCQLQPSFLMFLVGGRVG